MLKSAALAAQRAMRGWFEVDGQDEVATPSDETASFRLRFGDLEVADLTLEKGIWEFQYTDSFRRQLSKGGVQPLIDFPDANRAYRSQHLWPFFVARIPSVAQPRVQEEIVRRGLDQTSAPQLLKAFGERSISNPFVLQSA